MSNETPQATPVPPEQDTEETQQPLEELRRVRIEKLAELRAKGIEPYGGAFPKTCSFGEASERFLAFEKANPGVEHTEEVFQLPGRVIRRRPMGKTLFLTLQDADQQIQAYLNHRVLGAEAWELISAIDIGDILGFTGPLFRTKSGEISIRVTGFVFLSKALRPLPDKWHGLKDKELRFRNRHLDLISNPEVMETFRKRQRIINSVRSVLTNYGYLEVETPMLETTYGGAMARPFNTHMNSLHLDMYLRISVELNLKRLITGGFPGVFELGKDFRNEGLDSTHNPEFTMMEVNVAYFDYNNMMDLCEELMTTAAREVCDSLKIMYDGTKIDLTPPWERLSFNDAAKRYCNVDNADRLPASEVKKIADRIEEKLVNPVFLYDQPTCISPLAKKCADNPFATERFELIINGMEYANAYSELNDPIDQLARFQQQVDEKTKGDAEAHEMNMDYVECLEHAMPPNAGLGIGIDRLIMLLTNNPSIRDVILFPTMRPM